ncbi:MAG: hypothetical protein Q8P72_00970 [Candidatus Roizmanbacteria bacterium]|nr:hypothetical protein [Candidatus Roizmanbacteria bacterium]
MQNIFEQLQAETKKWRERSYATNQFSAISEILSWSKDDFDLAYQFGISSNDREETRLIASGKIAKDARIALEEKIGKSVFTGENFLPE